MSTPPVAPAPRPRRSARAVFCSAVLTFEIFVVLFAALVAFGLREPGTSVGPIWAVAGGGALLCLVGAATVTRPVGVWIGSAVQVLLVAAGIVVPAMFVVGLVFTALWVLGIVLGRRIDVERAERTAAEDRLRP